MKLIDRVAGHSDFRKWPDSSVAGIHSGPQLSGDKLPSVAIVHDGRI
jgi:hypothetical protein